jgi:ABC-type glycerol-3-phosphate transport system permease component
MATVTEARHQALRDVRTPRATYRLRSAGAQVGKYAVLLAFLAFLLLSFVWVWSSALKTSREILTSPLALPRSFHWENLERAWTIGRFDRYIGNTVLYSVTIVTSVVVLCCLGGYALALLRFPGSNVIFVAFLLGLMVPFEAIMIPMYYLVRDLNILATRWAMIIPSIALALPFGIFLMRAFYRGLPPELADAARVDGSTEWQVFRRVMLPLSAPGVITLVVFQFMWTWNAFSIPLILVQEEELRPVALGIMFFSGRYTSDQGMIAAGVTIATLPIILLYLALQRQFIRGITAGALKG